MVLHRQNGRSSTRGVPVKLSTILAAKGDFVATITPEATVADLAQALSDHRCGALVVSTDGRTIEGIVSERDVVRALSQDPDVLQRAVSSIMTSRVFTAPPDASVDDLMHVMTDERIRHIPIVEDGQLVGIVSIGDVVKSRLAELEGEHARLMEYINQG